MMRIYRFFQGKNSSPTLRESNPILELLHHFINRNNIHLIHPEDTYLNIPLNIGEKGLIHKYSIDKVIGMQDILIDEFLSYRNQANSGYTPLYNVIPNQVLLHKGFIWYDENDIETPILSPKIS